MEAQKKQGQFYNPNYKNDQARCQELLTQFIDPDVPEHHTHGNIKYMIMMQQVANNQRKNIDIYLEDIKSHFQKENERDFVLDIEINTMKFIKIFSQAVDQCIPPKDIDDEDDDEEENIQIINEQRRMNVKQVQQQQSDNAQILNNRDNNKFPPLLTRKFQLQIIKGPGEKQKILPIRTLRGDKIGSLVQIKAIVVRIFEVKPQLQVASFVCEQCGCENYQTIPNKSFLPIQECQSNVCKTNKLKGKLSINMSASSFTSYQEIVIQETSDQIPEGSIPRSFKVVAKGTNTRQCSAGDIVTIQGVFLPETVDTYRYGNQNLMMETYIEAFEIIRDKKKYVDMNLTETRKQELLTTKNNFEKFDYFYDEFSRSLCPEIFGLEDVKKALLLLMVGGLTNVQNDGIKIRGDINIALVGDPGIAKSQLLKQIANLSPRGVYTTGKGSSGVGLTASVMKDPVTNEVSLEAGALVLADMGVCCIDEFDKMNEYDRTSIHEVMEQQTVSIAKAGITTQLNARTSILAAANPQYGRYNRNMTAHDNINLPAALLSRFDLIFVLLDEPRELEDLELARHIGQVHMNLKATNYTNHDLDRNFIRDFISLAKSNENITLDPSIHEYLAQYYVQERINQQNTKERSSYVTPRTLLGIIRLAQAHARIRQIGQDQILVNYDDVTEAIRLITVTQEKLKTKDSNFGQQQQDEDIPRKIFEIIKNNCLYKKAQQYTDKYSHIEAKVFQKGYNGKQLEEAIKFYAALNSLQHNKEDNTITLIERNQ